LVKLELKKKQASIVYLKKLINSKERTFVAYLSVAVLISVDYGFVNDLLQLSVFEIAANHHFENQEELTV
jgi:hypothetical protein